MSSQGGGLQPSLIRTRVVPSHETAHPANTDVYHCLQRASFDTAASNPYRKVMNSWRQIGVRLNASDFLWRARLFRKKPHCPRTC